MAEVCSETHEKRPPTTSHTADVSEPPLSPFAHRRPLVTVRVVPGPADGIDPSDPYVRRFWVAAIGPAAVTDLLRLCAAAHRGREIPQPLSLPMLLSERLIAWHDGELTVPYPLPRVPHARLRRTRCLLVS